MSVGRIRKLLLLSLVLVTAACSGVARAPRVADPMRATSATEKTREPRTPEEVSEDPEVSPCDDRANNVVRTESWLTQFAVWEIPNRTQRFQLGHAIGYADVHSEIAIERIGSVPKTIWSTNGTNDARTGHDPHNLDLDVVVMRPTGSSTCRRLISIPDIQHTGGYDDPLLDAPGCEPNYQYFTYKREIVNGDKFIIPAGSFQHGDRVEIQFTGKEIGKETTYKKKKDGTTFEEEERTICGQRASVPFSILDYRSLAPIEGVPLIETTSRADIRHDVYVDFVGGNHRLTDGRLMESVDIQTTALGADGKSRKIELKEHAPRKTLSGLKDGDLVTVDILRRVKAGDSSILVPVNKYSFRAVRVGLHYAPTGDEKANYATASGMIVSMGDAKEIGFSQTFSYSLFYQPKYPTFWEVFGVGFHVSLLANSSASIGGEDEGNVSYGLGGQLTLGANVLHLGGGYDLKNEEPYLFLGLSLPDLAVFLKEED